MVRYERFVNDITLTLNGGVTDVATTMAVVDATGLPTEGDFRLVVQEEIMIVTGRTGNTLTVIRGAEGTTASAHLTGTVAPVSVTQGALDRFIMDFYDPYAFSRPPHRILDIDGNVLTASDFTWGNQGTSTVTDDTGGSITITPQTGVTNIRGQYKSAPTAPYSVTIRAMLGVGENAANQNGIFFGFRESATSKLVYHEFHYSDANQYDINYSTDWGTFNSQLAQAPQTGDRTDWWFKIENDDTDLIFYCSANGYNWFEIHSEAKATTFTTAPDEVFWGSSTVVANQQCHLLAWLEE